MGEVKESAATTVAAVASGPSRWWQWVLVYPALAISLSSAVPQWADKFLVIYNNVKNSSYAAAVKENQLWHKNQSCVAAPYSWYKTPKKMQVDATICDSGDVFVRFLSSNGQQEIRWVASDDVFASKISNFSLISSAYAKPYANTEDWPSPPSVGARPGYFQNAQFQNVVTICSRFVNQRYFLRRISTPQGCFDQLLDTFNGGLIVQNNPAPCVPQC